ncbi:MAG: hypothetical protein ACK55Z_02785, partial [bacterium]
LLPSSQRQDLFVCEALHVVRPALDRQSFQSALLDTRLNVSQEAQPGCFSVPLRRRAVRDYGFPFHHPFPPCDGREASELPGSGQERVHVPVYSLQLSSCARRRRVP